MKRPSGFSGEADPPKPHQTEQEPQGDTVYDAALQAQPSHLWSKFTKKLDRAEKQSGQAAEHVGTVDTASFDRRDMQATQPLEEEISKFTTFTTVGTATPQDAALRDGREAASVQSSNLKNSVASIGASLRHFVSRSRGSQARNRVQTDTEGSVDLVGPDEVDTAQEHGPVAVLESVPDSFLATGADSLRGDDRVAAATQEVKRAERARKAQERRDQRRFSATSRTRKRNWLFSIGAVAVLAATVLVGVFTPIMAVRTVEIAGAETVNIEEIHTALSRFEGVPLALVGDQDLHRALEPFPLIQRYSVERIPPSTLRVHIEERQPVIAIALDSGFRLVDAAGVLTGEVPELPPGIVRGNGGILDTSSVAFAAAAPVIRDLPEDIRMMMAEVAASGEQDIQFGLHSGVTIVWGDNTATQRKAVVMRAMLAAVPGAARIDVSAPEAPVFQ